MALSAGGRAVLGHWLAPLDFRAACHLPRPSAGAYSEDRLQPQPYQRTAREMHVSKGMNQKKQEKKKPAKTMKEKKAEKKDKKTTKAFAPT
jgi:hypothetical protein